MRAVVSFAKLALVAFKVVRMVALAVRVFAKTGLAVWAGLAVLIRPAVWIRLAVANLAAAAGLATLT